MSVYFAQVGHYIKIGYSANPERRVRRLFSGATRYGAPEDCPTDLASRQLIRAIPGDKDDEWQIQSALADFCVGLEWFVDEPPLRDYIATVEQSDDGYPELRREDGPVFDPYDEANLPADEMALLHQALQNIFATPQSADPAPPGRVRA